MERLFELARERKLDRVGATYAVVAWVLVQAASIALPAFEAPASSLRWLIVAMVVGFPLTLTLAWFAAGRTAAPLQPLRGRDWLLFGLLGAIALLLAVQLAIGFPWARKSAQSSPPLQSASSIAVLPFANLSGDAAKAYFSDGIADQLISELARTPSLRVAARSSSFAFRGKDVDVKTIAHALNVRTILEGSVREDGNRVRIAAELVDARNGFQIWSETYDRDLTNILALQDDIAHAITGALAKRFWGGTAIANRTIKPHSINPDAYRLYLQGQFYFAQRTHDGVDRAIALFARTTQLAPDYADGFAALADAHATKALNFQMNGDVGPALESVKKALSLDPNNPTAIIAQATASLLQWQWRAVAEDFKRLDRLHVNTAAAWRMRAVFFDYMGLASLAYPAEAKAVELDPLSFIDHYNLALYMNLQKRYDDAARLAADAWALQPGHPDLQVLKCQIALGKKDVGAAQRISTQLTAQGGDAGASAAACNFYIDVTKNDLASARKIADAVSATFPASGISATDIGTAYAMTGDADSAMKWYRRAFDVHDPQLPRVPYANPDLIKLFADPRWKALRSEPAIRDWEAARAEIGGEFQRGE
ncbi:MAG TPA: hypothetical protein VL286_00995 [Rhizomicrobium sp.]|nr:hypothetical protein [Rhizomicrobium sp.]